VIRVVVTAKGGEPTSEFFDKAEITIGRESMNDLVLPKGNISKRHARVVCKDDKIILVDLKSTNGTYLNGRKLTSPLVVHEGDKVYIGDFMLAITADHEEDEDTLDVDPTELRLLAAIAQREDGSRLVYADWLEEHGDHVRAEFLRAQEQLAVTKPASPAYAPLIEHVRKLAMDIDVKWRHKVARPAIENCVSFQLACPKDWGSLSTTERSDVRFCDACSQRVFYCTDIYDARRHAERGACVAIDVRLVRRRGDLDVEREIMMGRVDVG
jgi:uncharacterized protein (TIGR02996 family)